MIKILSELFGKANKSTPTARPHAGGEFRAVSVAPSLWCCAAAKQASGRRVLLREAPRLPLETCSMPADCSCKFRKNADRRDGDRRLLGATATNRWFAGAECRKRGSRRSPAT